MYDEEVFFYDEESECVSSLTKYHAEELSVEPLVEAHPDTIYFYATLVPWKDWDFNEYKLDVQTKAEISEIVKKRKG